MPRCSRFSSCPFSCSLFARCPVLSFSFTPSCLADCSFLPKPLLTALVLIRLSSPSHKSPPQPCPSSSTSPQCRFRSLRPPLPLPRDQTILHPSLLTTLQSIRTLHIHHLHPSTHPPPRTMHPQASPRQTSATRKTRTTSRSPYPPSCARSSPSRSCPTGCPWRRWGIWRNTSRWGTWVCFLNQYPPRRRHRHLQHPRYRQFPTSYPHSPQKGACTSSQTSSPSRPRGTPPSPAPRSKRTSTS